MNVRLNKDQKIKLLKSEDVYSVMQQILLRENKIQRNQEHFWIIGLDTSLKILFIELIGLGAVNRVHANPPDVFRMAIYKLAVKAILVHNHPSGNLELSKEDKTMTDHMMKVGEIIKIEVVDHLVITETGYTSLADEGIMDELKRSGAFEVVDKEKAEMKTWKQKMETERLIKESKLEIAKSLKDEGMDIDFIKKVTGLYKWDIKKL